MDTGAWLVRELVDQRTVATTIGAVLLTLGVLGFAPTLGVGPLIGEADPSSLLGLPLLHDLVHLVPGVGLLWAGRLADTSNAVTGTNASFGVAYIVVGIASFLSPGTVADVLAITPTENLLHLGTGIALVAAAFALEAGLAGTR